MNATEPSDLAFEFSVDLPVAATHQHIRLDADRAELLHGVLGGLGFQFAGGADVGQQGHMDVSQITATHIAPEFTDGLKERQGFDIANGPADLSDHHIRIAVGGNPVNAFADFPCDVRNHLNGAAVVVAAAFLVDHRLVDGAGGHAVQARHRRVGEAFVVAEIKIGLSTVLGDEHLTMLKRAHGARVNIQVRIQLQDRNAVTARFEQAPEAGGHDALADAGHHTTGDEDELGHDPPADSSMYRAPQGG